MLSAGISDAGTGVKWYAGVGARDTPDEIGVIMTNLATELESLGWVLREGRARGADTFFGNGVRDVKNRESFIHKDYAHRVRHDPSRNIWNAARFEDWDKAVLMASELHPTWYRCSLDAQGLHARNVYQVLGQGMLPERYSRFLVCWAIPDIHGVPEGGTRTAWKVAELYNIPRFNLAVREDRERITKWLELRQAYG